MYNLHIYVCMYEYALTILYVTVCHVVREYTTINVKASYV